MDLGDFLFQPVVVEKGFLAFIESEAIDMAGHDQLEEFLRAPVGRFLVDVDRIDIGGEDVADRADDHVAFFVDVDRRFLFADAADEDAPEAQEVGEVAGEFAPRAALAGGPDDESEPGRGVEFEHEFAEAAAVVVVFDLA